MNATIDISNTRLETSRLILRPWDESDLEDMYTYASVPGVGEMAGWHYHTSREISAVILDLFIQEKKTFALELKTTGGVIGSLGIEELSCDPMEDGAYGREIGYVLGKAYWGMGLMPEAVMAAMEYCFRELGLDYLTCGHFPENNQSRRVIEKCGFVYWGDSVFRAQTGEERVSRLYLKKNPYK